MRVLALEPYYGGSHKAFIDGWQKHGEHEWTVLGLPAYKWKWRMRHAAVTFAGDVEKRRASGETWDLVFCSDMLDLTTFLALAPDDIRSLPRVAYFHENQITYPVQDESERDYTYGFINMTTALASTRTWFNSEYHRSSFLESLAGLLKRMPDHQPMHVPDAIRERSDVWPQGIHPLPAREGKRNGPMRILWAARWEFDKDPETFFQALELLQSRGTGFRLSVIGEQFRDSPKVFEEARERFRDVIDHWGYQKRREDYQAALLEADAVVSTARHEFFGISIVEAVAAGAYPLLPRRLSYPELFSLDVNPDFFYENGAESLAERLGEMAQRCEAGSAWQDDPDRGRKIAERFYWTNLAPRLDAALTDLVRTNSS